MVHVHSSRGIEGEGQNVVGVTLSVGTSALLFMMTHSCVKCHVVRNADEL